MSSSTRHLVVAGLVGVSLLAVSCGDDTAQSPTTTTTTTTPSTTAPSTTTMTSTTTAPSVDQPETAVWPFASSATRYSDPVQAATSFAVDYLGFVDPIVSGFQQGDSRSGEVPIQAKASGAITTVFVRQLAPDDSWWVLGAASANLQIESPAALAAIASPLTMSGQSTAFEATVNFEIRQDGTLAPLKEGFFMGGSNGQMGPFSTTVEFGTATAQGGAIVLKTMSAENGNIWEASVIRVKFSG